MKQAGFTLLEVLISIVILSFVMLGVISITENSMNTRDRVVREDKEFLQIETALSRLEWDLSHLWSPLYFSNKMQGPGQMDPTSNNIINPNQQIYNQYYAQIEQRFQDNQNFMGLSEDLHMIPRFTSRSKESFQFFTNANRRKMANSKESNFAWVKYILEPPLKIRRGDDSEKSDKAPTPGKDLVRYFKAHNPWSAEDWDTTRTKPQVLMENVESMVFEFWNPERKKWETNLEVVGQGSSLLRAVKVIIEWTDSAGVDNRIERVFRPLFPNVIPEVITNTTGAAGGPGGMGNNGSNGFNGSGGFNGPNGGPQGNFNSSSTNGDDGTDDGTDGDDGSNN